MIQTVFQMYGLEYRLPLTLDEEIQLIRDTSITHKAISQACCDLKEMLKACDELLRQVWVPATPPLSLWPVLLVFAVHGVC